MTTEQNDAQGGHTPLTPPPASAPQAPAPASAPPAPAPSGDVRRSGGAKAITIVTAIVGGIALLGSGGAAAAAATGNFLASSDDRSDSVETVDVAGISSLELDVDAGDMRIEFADIDEARLAITNGRGPAWTFERDDDELVVRSPDGFFGWWFASWVGEGESAVLTLPESLRDSALDADLTLDAGSLDVDGDFGALVIDVSAGALNIDGAATSLDVDMSAGRADILLDGVNDAVLGISAGDLTVELTGTAPTRTAVDASAGSVDLTLPDVAYTIAEDVSAGTLDATVDQSAGTQRVIEVDLSAGTVTIRPGN